jgi:tetratricopeptide (TPR) repeat protein
MVPEEAAIRREAAALAKAGERLIDQEKRTEALLQLQRAVVLYAEIQAKPEIGRLKFRIGECLLALGQSREAEFFVKQALALLHAWGSKEDIARCYEALAFCQERAGQAEEAGKSREAAAFLLRPV